MKLNSWLLLVAILETVDVFYVVLYYNKENVLEFCNNSELFVCMVNISFSTKIYIDTFQ